MTVTCFIELSENGRLIKQSTIEIEDNGKPGSGIRYGTYMFEDYIYDNEDYYMILDEGEYYLSFKIKKDHKLTVARYKLTVQHIELECTKLILTDFYKAKRTYGNLFDVVKKSMTDRSLVHVYEINYFL